MAMHAIGSAIPHPLKVEHDTFFCQLDRAAQLPGRVGAIARRLADALQPHLVAEETYALPPLAVLHALADRETPAEAHAVIMMADRLRRELPTMHQEHRAITEMCRELAEAAREASNAEVEYFADTLALHAEMEEQVLYPAAVLVGDLLRLKLRL